MKTDDKLYKFLLNQKPICTESPLKHLLGSELHVKLRAKYKLELELDLLTDRCPNTWNCVKTNFSGECIGRPFPKDPKILKALKSINLDIEETSFKGVPVLMAKAIVGCSGCPLKESCSNPCPTVESYTNRSTTPDYSPTVDMCINLEEWEAGKYGPTITSIGNYEVSEFKEYLEHDSEPSKELPLDCLTDQQRKIVEMILYEGLEQMFIAKRLGCSQQHISNQYKAAITKMTEFALVREVISKIDSVPGRVRLYYIENKTQQEIADMEGISQDSISKYIDRWKLSNKL